MKKFLILSLIFILSLSTALPSLAGAQELENNPQAVKVETFEGTTFETYVNGNIRTVVANDGESEVIVKYNTETDELIVNEETIGDDQVNSIKEFGKNVFSSPNEKASSNSSISPFAVEPNDPGDGYYTFEWEKFGSVNLQGLSATVAAAVIVAMFPGVGAAVAGTLISGLFSSVTNDKYVFYYRWTNWSYPHPGYPGIKERLNIVSFYKDSSRKQYVDQIRFT